MKILPVLFIASLIASTPVLACEPTADEMRDFYARWRQADEANARAAIQSADSIFTGTVTRVELKRSKGYLQTALVTTERTLKGHPPKSVSFLFGRELSDEQRIDALYVCGEVPDTSNPSVTETYPYLMYVRDGVLIRATPLPLGEAPLPAETEMEMVKRLATGRQPE
jgi:hypothetical protein